MTDTAAEQNPIEQAAELAGMPLNMRIEDGVFMIEPSDAGIALLAAIRTQQEDIDTAWTSVDEMAEALEKMHTENSLFREVLQQLADLLDSIGYDTEASRINKMLWKVVGIDDEGNEIAFDYFDDEQEGDAQ
jgi:hypothetical protein